MSTPTADAPAKSKKNLLLIGLVMVLAAAGFYFTTMRPAAGEEKPEPGVVLQLEPVHVNLAGGGYLKIGLALQFSADAAGHGEPNGAHALDLTIAQFSQASPVDVAAEREKLKAELEKKIVKEYHGDVLAIFLTEYVTQ